MKHQYVTISRSQLISSGMTINVLLLLLSSKAADRAGFPRTADVPLAEVVKYPIISFTVLVSHIHFQDRPSGLLNPAAEILSLVYF